MGARESERSSMLVESAFHLFSQMGIAKVNMDSIAAEAGVTKGSLYHHFKSKQEVILGACQYYYQRWEHNTREKMRDGSNALERLEKAIQFSVRSCLLDRHNRIFTLEVLTLSLYDDDIKESWAGFYQHAADFYTTLVLECIQAELIPAHRDSTERVFYMLNTMEGIKQQAHFDNSLRTRQSERSICDHLLRTLVD